MERLGKEMVGWCSGNPLAILVLRGVLVTKPSLVQWKIFYNTSKGNKHQQLVQGDVAEVLALSYNELPYQLKPCYLYLCRNRGKAKISVDRLYMLWSAEGMVLSRDRKQGEATIDVAERYLGELVRRNMVEIDLDGSEGPKDLKKIKLCHLHDLMRELCLSKIIKEDFFKITDVDFQRNKNDFRIVPEKLGENKETLDVFPKMGEYSSKIYRHAISFSPDSKWYINVAPETSASIRSLLIKQGSTKKLSNLKKLKLLRVLDLESVGIEDGFLSEGIGDLIHMRFFSLYEVNFVWLPYSLGNLMHLQTLDLRVETYLIKYNLPHIPNVLWKLRKLRHLFLPHDFRVILSSLLRLDGLPELVTLINFDARKCCMGDLTVLTNLRRFTASILFEFENCCELLEAIINHIIKNQLNLRRRSLAVEFPEIGMEKLGDGWKQVLSGCHWIIDSLRLRFLKCGLPEFLMVTNRQYASAAVSSFPLLTKLTLNSCTFDQDPMPILEKLSTLRNLSIDELKIIQGNEITCSSFGFLQLRKLSLIQTNLEKWRIEQGAMPNLVYLGITGCSMEMLPEGLKFIATLQTLTLISLSETIEKRIQPPDGEDFCIIQHVPEVILINCKDTLSFYETYSHQK